MDRNTKSGNPNTTAGWIATPTSQSMFVWSYRQQESSELGVIIIGPIGPESLHCHRSIKCLAEKLQGKGITTLRYDHTGMGNSSSNLLSANLMEEWIANISALHHHLIKNLRVKSVAIVALRSASILAAKYLETCSVDHLVLWYPYSQGAAFYRDVTMIDGILEASGDGIDSYVNAGGYPVTNETAEALKSINLLKMESQVEKSVFTIQSKESRALSKLQEYYLSRNISYQHRVLPSLPKMARMAQFSEVPVEDIDLICQQLLQYSSNPENNFLEPTEQISERFISDNYTESVLISDNSPRLFSIVCEAEEKHNDNSEKPIIIITNGGAAHHIGPNRLHTELARDLASKNFTSIRFDLSTLGDSPAKHSNSNPNPYPTHAVDDIENMLNVVSEKYNPKKVVIIGLCSGAHNAFHAQLNIERFNIHETILINPLTFYMRDGDSTLTPESVNLEMNKNYYQGQARSFKVWLELLKNPAKIFRLSVFVIKIIIKKIYQIIKPLAQTLGLASPDALQKDIEKLLERNRHLSFFISNNDPGHNMIMQQAGKAVKKGKKSGLININITSSVDHTFTTLESRRELIQSITSHLADRYT